MLFRSRRTFTTNGVASGQLFAAMDVRFPGLPSPTGTFFFHFKDPADSGVASAFTGRIHVSTAGAWPGALRVGVAWGTGTPVFVARDIATNTQCRLVLRLDFATTNAVLWVNPASEADMQGSALATDARGVGQGLSQVAFRQATGLGEVEVDALRVGTRFEDVADAVPPLAGIERNAEGCRVWMPTSAWQGGWRVEAAGALRGPWTPGPEMTVEGSRAWALVPENKPLLWFRLVRR